MWDPSTSASVIIIILWYLSSSRLKSGLNPVPSAWIKVAISAELTALSGLAFSVFKILPFKGRTAWFFLSLACLAEPPAESPSTINNSQFSADLSWQSASFPGNELTSKAEFFLETSLAFLAASLAAAASKIFVITAFESFGFSSNQLVRFSATIDSTTGLTSDDTNLSLVCDENLGSGTCTDKIQVNPSLASSPVKAILSFFEKPELFIAALTVLVNAERNPAKWVPPSLWGILLVKTKQCS